MQGTAPQAAVYRPEKAVVAVGTGNESTASAISWGAIIGGAFAAAAMGLILVALGTGLGFAAVSPWSNSGRIGDDDDHRRRDLAAADVGDRVRDRRLYRRPAAHSLGRRARRRSFLS